MAAALQPYGFIKCIWNNESTIRCTFLEQLSSEQSFHWPQIPDDELVLFHVIFYLSDPQRSLNHPSHSRLLKETDVMCPARRTKGSL